MKIASFIFGTFLLCAGAAAQTASPAAQRREEVAHLLDFVEQSKCEFKRNGTWHESRDARLHLQKKYDYLDRRNLAPDAESFISRGASQSSMSGQPYQVRCTDGKVMPSARWLTEELARFRQAPAR
jgi:hypothetical protein